MINHLSNKPFCLPKRFRDNQERLARFADEFLVVCPRCRQCARVTPLPTPADETWHELYTPHRLLCPSCTYTKDQTTRSVTFAHDRDWYFDCPLWLTVRCAGGQIYAFNYRHLIWLEEFIGATLRERRPNPEWGWSSRSAINIPPRWIKSAKNRRDILHGIGKLKRGAGR